MNGGFTLQARRFHASKHLIQPLYMILQGWCCDHDIIDITHDGVTVFLGYIRECLGRQSQECGRSVAQSERHPLPLEQSQLAREARFLPILLSEWHLPERRAQIQRREELRVPQLGEALIDAGNRVCVLYSHCVQVTEITTKPELPPSFLAMTTPQAHGDFDGSIMSYSINISISLLHASNLYGFILLAPSL